MQVPGKFVKIYGQIHVSTNLQFEEINSLNLLFVFSTNFFQKLVSKKCLCQRFHTDKVGYSDQVINYNYCYDKLMKFNKRGHQNKTSVMTRTYLIINMFIFLYSFATLEHILSDTYSIDKLRLQKIDIKPHQRPYKFPDENRIITHH